MPQLDVATYPSLIFWLCVSFLLLYGILSRFLLPRISGVLDAREGHLKKLDLEIEGLMNQVQVIQEKMERQLDGARRSARERLDEVDGRYQAILEERHQVWQKIVDERTRATTAELDKQQAHVIEAFAQQLPRLVPLLYQRITGQGGIEGILSPPPTDIDRH